MSPAEEIEFNNCCIEFNVGMGNDEVAVQIAEHNRQLRQQMEPQAHYGDVSLAEALLRLAHEIRESRRVSEAQLAWFQSHAQSPTTEQLNKKLEELVARVESAITRVKDDMAIKLSELKGEVAGIRSQVSKIWGEQQAKYDNLVIEFDKLKLSLDNAELPPDVEQDLNEFKAELKAFDDTIPDITV